MAYLSVYNLNPPSMVAINTLKIDPPLVNTACAWVSEYEQLKACFECPYTGAVTTRTAAGVDEGYPRLAGVHGVRTLISQNSSLCSSFTGCL